MSSPPPRGPPRGLTSAAKVAQSPAARISISDATHLKRRLQLEGIGPRSLFCFNRGNKIRECCISLTARGDNFIFFVIGLNCVIIAMDSGQYSPTSDFGQFLHISEIVFLLIFLIEFVIKVIALGFFFNGKKSYLRSAWNALDFVIIVVGLLGKFVSGDSLSFFRAIRTLRVLRSLKAHPSLQILLSAVLNSLAGVADVFFLLSTVLFVYGLIGLNLFSGVFLYRCYSIRTGEMVGGSLCSPRPSDHYDEHSDCEAGYFCADSGSNLNVLNFDNIFSAWLTAFSCMTLEGWIDIMYDVVHSTNYWSTLYFGSLVFVGSFLLMNFLIGVIFSSFEKAKAAAIKKLLAGVFDDRTNQVLPFKGERSVKTAWGVSLSEIKGPTAPLTEDNPPPPPPVPGIEPPPEQAMLATGDDDVKAMLQDLEDRGFYKIWGATKTRSQLSCFESCVIYPCFKFHFNSCFQYFFAFVIFTNTVALVGSHEGMSSELILIQDVINNICTCLFLIEMATSLLGLGPRAYFGDAFHLFDFIIIAIALGELVTPSGSSWYTSVVCIMEV
jgi:hypothetical protein